jgi:hypothetical protein
LAAGVNLADEFTYFFDLAGWRPLGRLPPAERLALGRTRERKPPFIAVAAEPRKRYTAKFVLTDAEVPAALAYVGYYRFHAGSTGGFGRDLLYAWR